MSVSTFFLVASSGRSLRHICKSADSKCLSGHTGNTGEVSSTGARGPRARWEITTPASGEPGHVLIKHAPCGGYLCATADGKLTVRAEECVLAAEKVGCLEGAQRGPDTAGADLVRLRNIATDLVLTDGASESSFAVIRAPELKPRAAKDAQKAFQVGHTPWNPAEVKEAPASDDATLGGMPMGRGRWGRGCSRSPDRMPPWMKHMLLAHGVHHKHKLQHCQQPGPGRPGGCGRAGSPAGPPGGCFPRPFRTVADGRVKLRMGRMGGLHLRVLPLDHQGAVQRSSSSSSDSDAAANGFVDVSKEGAAFVPSH